VIPQIVRLRSSSRLVSAVTCMQGDVPCSAEGNPAMAARRKNSEDVEGHGTERLRQHEGYTVPEGVVHRPRSPQRAAVLVVESLGIRAASD
jgi:hypothetical protein